MAQPQCAELQAVGFLGRSLSRDYIKAHQNAYEDILKHEGEEALSYMLSQIEQGKADGLRGQLMLGLCKEMKALLKAN